MTKESSEKTGNPTAGELAAASLTGMMRERTRVLHTRAERSGIVNDVLRGKASRCGYALLLRNLLPAYRSLETGLEAHRRSPGGHAAARRELYRAPAIASDLKELVGAQWENALPLLAAGENYGRRVAIAAEHGGAGLIAHAYTRYLGDLSGGQVLKRLLSRTLLLRPQELTFFEFPEISDIEAFKRDYCGALDRSAAAIANVDAVVAEAMAAFELNIAVSEAVQQASKTAA